MQLLLKGIGMVPRKTLLLVIMQIHFIVSVSQASSPDYYTVHDGSLPVIQEVTIDPIDTFTEVAEAAIRNLDSVVLDLMEWVHHEETLQDPSVPYNRKSHYGSWVRDPRDSNCYNTRAKVLIRSSAVPVSFSNSNRCTVKGGQWHDPYSSRVYSEASDIQIDHVVPLKNSYVSGGWKWDSKKRCLYANFLSNDFHLMAVNGPDNMRKGDRTPEEFMPPNAAYACEYLSIWLKIKLIWNLAMKPSEANAIAHLVRQNSCNSLTLSMATQELSQQRQAILDNMVLCASRKQVDNVGL